MIGKMKVSIAVLIRVSIPGVNIRVLILVILREKEVFLPSETILTKPSGNIQCTFQEHSGNNRQTFRAHSVHMASEDRFTPAAQRGD
jgi:hypothetical protein